MGAEAAAHFEVQGLRLSVTGAWPEVIENLRLDLGWFEAPPDRTRAWAPDVGIVVERRPPDFDAFGDVQATFVTPRNVVYQQPGRTIVDYFGRAVSVVDRTTGDVTVQGEDEGLVLEAAYHYALSRIGEHLDARGLTRLHALGLVGSDGAVAVMLPSGGGKSTLALRALRSDGVRLVSEDSPLLDRRGRLHPFPLRIAVNETDAEALPPGRARRFERMESHPKLVLEMGAFADRVESEPKPLRHLVVGRRTLGRGASLEPLPRRAVVGTLVREAVVGVGIYQGMEFILQRGMRDVAGKLGMVANRCACCAAGLARAKVWRYEVGRDLERNWETLLPLLS